LIAFREVGRLLSSWRDTSVHRKTLKELRKEYPGILSQLKGNERLVALLKKTVPMEDPTDEIKSGIEEIESLLSKAGYRIRFQSMTNLDPRLLLKDLELTYDSVTDIYLRCRNNLKPSDIHYFRKRSKDFLYQLYFFRPLNTSVVKSLEKKLDSMTQNLGKYNDLTQLINALGYKYPDNRSGPEMDELVIKIREKQDVCLTKVWPLAYKIFCPGQKLVNVLGFKLLVI
jgi:CHAD domain-containing protein